MARISFPTADGGEKAYKLDKTRALKLGRDPGNDIVLRDARISRQHAEIAFERGFFVLHDLSSANGSWVNGRRVKVAPLTDGAEIRLGGTIGQFSEELIPPEGPTSTESYDRTKGPEPPAENPMETLPHEKGPEPAVDDPIPVPETKHDTQPVLLPTHAMTLALATEPEPDDPGIPIDEVFPAESPPAAAQPASGKQFFHSRYWTDPAAVDGELRVVRDEAEQPLFYFQRSLNFVGCFGASVAAAMAIAGMAALVAVLLQHRYVAATGAFLLTSAFTLFVLALIPRREIHLFNNLTLDSVALHLTQEGFSFPALRFAVRQPGGEVIATLTRSSLSRLGRHQWVVRIGGDVVGAAKESSLPVALLQNFLGTFFGRLRTPFEIEYLGRHVGSIARPITELHYSLLDLRGDPQFIFDRRIALALALVVDGVEKK